VGGFLAHLCCSGWWAENVKIFMRTYLNSLAKKLLKSEKKNPEDTSPGFMGYNSNQVRHNSLIT